MIQSEEINKTIGLSKWHPYNVSTSMDPEGYRSTDTLYDPSLCWQISDFIYLPFTSKNIRKN